MSTHQADLDEQQTGEEEVITGCGERLRQAREAAGLSLEQAARRVHLSMRVLNALEEEKWAEIGAPVFVRGHLRSYAQILGLDAKALLEQAHLSQLKSPVLHSDIHIDPSEMRPRIGRSLLIALVMLIVAAPILWQVLQSPDVISTPAVISPSPETTQTIADTAPIEQPLIEFTHIAPIRSQTDENETALEDGPAAEIEAEAVDELEDEVVNGASQLRLDQATPFLSLSFKGESWVEIRAANGSILESGLISAGQLREFEPGQVSRIKLGNASGVEVRQAGEVVETSRLGRGNVVHFRVSLDGSVQPVVAAH